ncbi:MAG: hypothetical protein Q8R88_02610 [Desulfoprunum sp.]|nr:hypothetical protein [Desulfoprunum sp.]
MFFLLKKLALYVLIVLGIMYGYQYMTGKSIATLPREIVNKLQDKGPAESTNPKYMMTPDEQIPKN